MIQNLFLVYLILVFILPMVLIFSCAYILEFIQIYPFTDCLTHCSHARPTTHTVACCNYLYFQTENVGQFYSNHIHGKTDNMDLYYHVNCYLTPPLHFELDLFLHDQKATT